MQNSKGIYQLFILAMLLTTVNSCKKENAAPVVKKDVVITWASPADITAGTALGTTQLNATASTPGTFVFTPASGTVLSTGASQNLKVDFTPTDAVHFNTATKTVTINVVPLTVTDIDGNLYHTVAIGTQTWMVENLKVTRYRNGDAIPNVTDATAWANLSTGAWSNYDHDASKGTIYGKLYIWYTVIDPRGLAPAGWHIPSDAELTTLVSALGGFTLAGGPLKETGTLHWLSPNTGATNSSGWTGLPSGCRNYDGSFGAINYDGYWWSSTPDRASIYAWNYDLYRGFAGVERASDGKNYGFSVRCIKD